MFIFGLIFKTQNTRQYLASHFHFQRTKRCNVLFFFLQTNRRTLTSRRCPASCTGRLCRDCARPTSTRRWRSARSPAWARSSPTSATPCRTSCRSVCRSSSTDCAMRSLGSPRSRCVCTFKFWRHSSKLGSLRSTRFFIKEKLNSWWYFVIPGWYTQLIGVLMKRDDFFVYVVILLLGIILNIKN